ncbi:MAG: M20 family metallo-hydrolase [Intestinimonas sp.]|nr:M20 family metallo-hydrolase [Intestinimonas sp.]
MEYGIDAVRIESMLTRLAKITATPGQGVTRLPFTPEMSRAAVLLEEWMTDAGLAVRQDASGAVIGTLRGERDRTVVIASHYDSVQYGGAYDGSAGVVCGIEIARAFAKRGKPLDTLAIVATNDEEGARFGSGFFSTKAFLGQHTDESLSAAKDACGISTLQAMRQFGLSPERLPEAAWDLEKVAAFLEIHIEQSTALEQAGAVLGIVTGIVGMRRRMITVYGRAGHAGTVPMLGRCDAMEIASAAISRVGDIARGFPQTVATVGHIAAESNEINTIAKQVTFSLDVRSPDLARLEATDRLILEELKQACDRFGGRYETTVTLEQPPAPMDEGLQALLTACAKERGIPVHALPSGAGHDSLLMASRVPTAMLFVPSRDGISHCPEEWSDCGHLAHAAGVACAAIEKIMKQS